MRASFSPVLLLASCTFSLALTPTSDRIDLCGTQAYSKGYNASGNITVKGFQVNATYPMTKWTWTRYVSDEPQAGTNNTALWQTFGLETTPEMNLSDPTLPYTGCIIVPRSVMVSGREDDGSCSGILNSGCISEIFARVNTSASLFSGRQKGSSATFSCPQLIKAITTSATSKCHDQWAGSISTEFLPNDFSADAISPRRCVPQNQTGHPFFGWAKEPNSLGDFSDYDQAVRTPHPVIVAVWLKAQVGTVDDEKDQVPRWADTRLFCVPANNTRPGSRTLAAANRAAGAAGAAAGRIETLNKGTMSLTMLVGIVFGLML